MSYAQILIYKELIMNEVLQKEYQSKLMSAREAVGLVRSGDTIYVGASSSVAYGLCEAPTAIYSRKTHLYFQ